MALTHTSTFTYSAGSLLLSGSAPRENALENNAQVAIAASAEGTITEGIEVARLTALLLLVQFAPAEAGDAADRKVSILPDAVSPPDDEPIVLWDNEPLIWSDKSPFVLPITKDIMALVVTNANAERGCTVTMMALLDPA